MDKKEAPPNYIPGKTSLPRSYGATRFLNPKRLFDYDPNDISLPERQKALAELNSLGVELNRWGSVDETMQALVIDHGWQYDIIIRETN